MSRIVLTTFGSAGDLNPMLALGIGLRERGHIVAFAVEDNFGPSVMALGFTAHHLTGDSVAALAPYALRMASSNDPIVSMRLLLQHYLLPTLPDKIEDLKAACSGADLLVSTAIHFAAAMVAELTGMRWASVVLTPAVLPSAHITIQPPPFALPPTLQRLSNRASWGLGGLIVRPLADRPVNRIRAACGLPPCHDVVWEGSLSSQLTCLAYSPAFQPPAPDWPASVFMTGFCFWDTPIDWTPSPELRAFLDDSAPLVAVTAGSIAPGTAEAFEPFYRTGIEAIRRAGARALVIGADPARRPPSPLPEPDVVAVAFSPYSQIFPHCAAVIHHGGIGTAAQALRYGVPALVVPWGFDQYYTAGRLADIGAGCTLPRNRYTAERAARVLTDLLHDPRYARTAQTLRDQIAREDGVGALCAKLEGLLAA